MIKFLTITLIISTFAMTSLAAEDDIGDYIRRRKSTKPVRIGLGVTTAALGAAAALCGNYIKNERDRNIAVTILVIAALGTGIASATTE